MFSTFTESWSPRFNPRPCLTLEALHPWALGLPRQSTEVKSLCGPARLASPAACCPPKVTMAPPPTSPPAPAGQNAGQKAPARPLVPPVSEKATPSVSGVLGSQGVCSPAKSMRDIGTRARGTRGAHGGHAGAAVQLAHELFQVLGASSRVGVTSAGACYPSPPRPQPPPPAAARACHAHCADADMGATAVCSHS